MTMLFFPAVLCFSGIVFSGLIFQKKTLLCFGTSFPVGAMLYILFKMLFSTIHYHAPWQTLLLMTGISISCFFFFFKYMQFKEQHKFDVYDYILLLLNAIVWLISLRSFVGYDQINHFFHAAQIQQEILPPHGFAFCETPVKYHYGWDILLADLSTMGNLSFADAEDILSFFFIISNSFVLLYILKQLVSSRLWYFTGFFVFIYGSGVLQLLKPGNYLCFFYMYHQHAWAFTTSVLLFCLAFIQEIKSKQPWYKYCLVLLPALATSVYSAHAVLLWGLFLAFGGIYALLLDKKNNWLPVAIFSGIGLTLLLFWKLTNWGIMISGKAYDNPEYLLSIKLLGLHEYCRYMGGYVLMTPIALVVFLGCIFYLVKYKLSEVKHLPSVILFCGVCVILLYPIPFICMIANSAYWDNFCKFNYIGILCAWIIFPCVLYKFSLKKSAVKYLLIVVMLSVSFSFILSKLLNLPYQQENSKNTQGMPLLHEKLKKLPYGKILILNPKLKTHYDVNRITNKANINLYQYIYTYFGRFTFLAMQYGFPIINFYDYNFMYNRKLEYAQIDALDALYHGDAAALSLLDVDYVLTPFERISAIEKAEKQGLLQKAEANKKENWILFLMRKNE